MATPLPVYSNQAAGSVPMADPTANTDFWRRLMSGEPGWQVMRDAIAAQNNNRLGMHQRLLDENARRLDDSYLQDPAGVGSTMLPRMAPNGPGLPLAAPPGAIPMASPSPMMARTAPGAPASLMSPTPPAGPNLGTMAAGGGMDPRLMLIGQGAAPPDVNGRTVAPLPEPPPARPDAIPDPAGVPPPGAMPPTAPEPDPLSAAYGAETGVAPPAAGTVTPTSPADRRAAIMAGLPEAPKPELPDNSGWRDLMRFGLATTAAGAQPGSTWLGAMGKGGLAAMESADADMLRRNQLKQQAYSNDLQRTGTAANIAASDTKETQTDRQLDIEDKKVVESAKTRLLELSQRKEDKQLDRDVRERMGQDAIDLKRLIVSANAGNQQALLELKKAEGDRKGEADATKRDQDAGTLYEQLLGRYKDAAGQIAPGKEQQAKEEVASAYPKSEMGSRYHRGDAASKIAQINASALPDDEKKKRVEAIQSTFKHLTGKDW